MILQKYIWKGNILYRPKNDKIYLSKNLVIIMSLPVLHFVGKKLAQKRYSTPNTLNYYSPFYFLNVFIDDDKY